MVNDDKNMNCISDVQEHIRVYISIIPIPILTVAVEIMTPVLISHVYR